MKNKIIEQVNHLLNEEETYHYLAGSIYKGLGKIADMDLSNGIEKAIEEGEFICKTLNGRKS